MKYWCKQCGGELSADLTKECVTCARNSAIEYYLNTVGPARVIVKSLKEVEEEYGLKHSAITARALLDFVEDEYYRRLYEP
jgi:hypothetical protein